MCYFLPICFSVNVLAVNFGKTFYKEIYNGKFSKMFGCVFGGFVGEIPANVKFGSLGKQGGGGLSGIERVEQIVKIVHALTSFPKTSYNVSTLHRSASHLSNFSW
jgi:hypothetical protein